MSLPRINAPEYELVLPSNKKKIKYRPFLVREEKNILMSIQSKDEREMEVAMKQVISDCTFNKLDIESLPLIDIETLFLNMRMRSKGEQADIGVRCLRENDKGEACNTVNEVQIDLNNVEMKGEFVDSTIMITDKVGVEMQYPTLSTTTTMISSDSKDVEENIDRSLDVIRSCVKTIFQGDEVFDPDDFTREEIKDFFEGMTKEQLKRIKDFIDSTPKLVTSIEFKCSCCGKTTSREVEGVLNFLK